MSFAFLAILSYVVTKTIVEVVFSYMSGVIYSNSLELYPPLSWTTFCGHSPTPRQHAYWSFFIALHLLLCPLLMTWIPLSYTSSLVSQAWLRTIIILNLYWPAMLHLLSTMSKIQLFADDIFTNLLGGTALQISPTFKETASSLVVWWNKYNKLYSLISVYICFHFGVSVLK